MGLSKQLAEGDSAFFDHFPRGSGDINRFFAALRMTKHANSILRAKEPKPPVTEITYSLYWALTPGKRKTT